MKRRFEIGLSLCLLALLPGCAEDGEGTALFTTWGEEYIEQGIPADPAGEEGFVDGWTVRFDKFLVVFHAIEVADGQGRVGGAMAGSLLVDNTRPGVKDLVSFPKLEAKAWDRVSYQIKPADDDTELLAGSASDLALMRDNGYSLLVAGTATKKDESGATIEKTFNWGFTTATQYQNCQQATPSGQVRRGLVVTNGGVDVSELTTHGDHFFYDRLMASDDPAQPTSLRFQEKADADADGDGEVTLEELDQTPIDVRVYDPSGLRAPTLGTFVTSLARTVGHFRGEGECAVSAL